MTTWSLTPFFNELDVLEIRLAELDPVVDVHVIAESTRTFSGVEKPLHFKENEARFAQWAHKIRHVVVEDSPLDMRFSPPPGILIEGDSGHWDREHHQREALMRAVDDLANGDLVLVSDLDEIPRPEAFNPQFRFPVMAPYLTLSEMWINWRWAETIPVVARFCTGEYLKRAGIQGVARGPFQAYGDTRVGSGWHFSYLGGVDGVRVKLAAAAHQELMCEPFIGEKWITHCLTTGKDLFGRSHRQSYYVPLDQLPVYVQKHQDRFAHLLGPEIPCL